MPTWSAILEELQEIRLISMSLQIKLGYNSKWITKDMDLKNNKIGLLAAKQLLRQRKLNKKEILQFFKKSLGKDSLVILKRNIKNQTPDKDIELPDVKKMQDSLKTKGQGSENKPFYKQKN